MTSNQEKVRLTKVFPGWTPDKVTYCSFEEALLHELMPRGYRMTSMHNYKTAEGTKREITFGKPGIKTYYEMTIFNVETMEF